MAVIKRQKPVVLTGAAASSFLSGKRMNEKKQNNTFHLLLKKHTKIS